VPASRSLVALLLPRHKWRWAEQALVWERWSPSVLTYRASI